MEEPQEAASLNPGDFKPDTRIFELPFAQNGKRLAVRIRAIEPLEALTGMKTIPLVMAKEVAEGKAFVEQVVASMEAEREPHQRLAAMAVIEPQLCFDAPQEGKVFWGDISYENRQALMAAILEQSGTVQGAVAAFLTFRLVLGRGAGTGAGAGGNGADVRGDAVGAAAGGAAGDDVQREPLGDLAAGEGEKR